MLFVIIYTRHLFSSFRIWTLGPYIVSIIRQRKVMRVEDVDRQSNGLVGSIIESVNYDFEMLFKLSQTVLILTNNMMRI